MIFFRNFFIFGVVCLDTCSAIYCRMLIYVMCFSGRCFTWDMHYVICARFMPGAAVSKTLRKINHGVFHTFCTASYDFQVESPTMHDMNPSLYLTKSCRIKTARPLFGSVHRYPRQRVREGSILCKAVTQGSDRPLPVDGPPVGSTSTRVIIFD